MLFKETGTIRLGTLYKYRCNEKRAIRDEYEGRFKRKIEPNNEPIEFTADGALLMVQVNENWLKLMKNCTAIMSVC